ncbi:MAG: hypothetical protein V1872_07975 [bacterium]
MDTSILSNTKLSRADSTKNPLGISKYYPGYSLSFVEDSINYLSSGNEKIILDPWAGIGTTGWAGQKRGLTVNLFDLNPVMSIFSAASDLSLSETKRKLTINKFLDKINNTINKYAQNFSENNALLKPNNLITWIVASLSFLSKTGMFSKERKISSEHALIASALITIWTNSISVVKTSNPTYYKSFSYKKSFKKLSLTSFCNILLKEVQRLLDNVRIYSGENRFIPLNVYYGDSKAIPIPDLSIDIIITSPPYCTRIDYARMTGAALYILEIAGICKFDSIRRNLMGAPTINIRTGYLRDYWGQTCIEFLKLVETHPAHGSKNYYYKNFIQYFDDAYKSLIEIERCLKDNGSGILVVQNSFYKGHEIKLSQIYKEMFQSLNIHAEILTQNIVKNCIASKHSQFKKYSIRKRTYTEDVIYFYKRKGGV